MHKAGVNRLKQRGPEKAAVGPDEGSWRNDGRRPEREKREDGSAQAVWGHGGSLRGVSEDRILEQGQRILKEDEKT